jgi:hypothetical protein
MFPRIHIVVNVNINLELKVFAYDQLAALSERFFHVIVRRVPHNTPKRILHAALGGADGVIYTIAPSL